MAGKPLKKSSLPGVSIRQLVEEIPEGCSLPDFMQKPVTLALPEGKNAIFRAVVCGEPRPEVHWESTGGDLSNSSKYQISSTPGSKEHVLQINKLTGEDSDVYRCTAVNMYGEATCSARLTVIEVGFRKNRKRQKEPQEDLRKELMDLRKMLKKRTPPPAPKKKLEPEQVWQLLMTADRKDYEKICLKYGIVDFRGMLRKLQEMKKEQEDRMAQYVNAISNLRHIRVTKEGVATFDLELDLKDFGSRIYLYKDHEMIPYGFDNQTKHCLRRLGKRYNFQIRDLRPEDAGLYQVMVEDTVVFSTELEASAIPPRVVVPLAEAHCEEQEDAVFECTLSSPCPNAAWTFRHRPLRLSDKYETFVSPDGLTHRLVVRGARVSDMGLYSLDTGLHASSAWLIVEAGKDKPAQTTDADLQLQAPGAPASDAEDTWGFSGEGGKSREQGSLEGTEPASGTLLTAGPGGDGFGRRGSSLMGGEGTANSAWSSGQGKKGFLEAERDMVTLPGDNRPRQDGDWGTPRSWEAGYSHSPDGRLGSSREGGEPREGNDSELNRHGQGQLWDPHLGAGAEQRALWGSQSAVDRSLLKGEGTEILQGSHLDEVEGGDGLSRESGRGVWASGTHLGEAGGSSGPGSPGTSGFPGRRGSSSKAGTGPEFWGSQGGGGVDHGQAGGYWKSGGYPGQTPTGSDTEQSSLPGGKRLLLGPGSPEANGRDSPQRTSGQGSGTAVGGRDYKTVPGGPGDPRGWEGSLQELQGKDGEGSRSRQSPQSGTMGQRRAGGPGRTECESTGSQDDAWSSFRKTGTRFGPGALGSGGEEGSTDDFQAAILMESGQGGARNGRLAMSPGLSAYGSGGTTGDAEGLRDSGSAGPKSDFWNGSRSSREKGLGGEMGYKDGLGDPGKVGSRFGDGSGCARGVSPRNGAAYQVGSSMPGETGPGPGTGYKAASERPVEIESQDGGTSRHGSGLPGEMWSTNGGHRGPAESGSGRVASFENASGGHHGMPVGEAWKWDASGGQKQAGPGGQHYSDGGLGSPGIVESVRRGGLKGSGTTESIGEGHMEIGPGDYGRIKSWGQTGDYGGLKGSGTMETIGEGHMEIGPGDSGRIKSWGQTGDYGGLKGSGTTESIGEGHMEIGPGDSGRIKSWGQTGDYGGLKGSGTTESIGEGHMEIGPGDPGRIKSWGQTGDYEDFRALGALGAFGEGGFGDGTGAPEAREPGSLGGGVKEGDGNRIGFLGNKASGDRNWDDVQHHGVLAAHAEVGSKSHWVCGPGNEVGYGDECEIPGSQGTRDRTAYGGGSKHFGPRRTGPEGESGFTDGSGGLRGMGLTGEVGCKNGSGASGLTGPGGKADYKNGLGPSGMSLVGSGKGYAGELEHSGDILSCGEAGFRDTLGGAKGMGSDSERCYRGGSQSSGEMGSEAEMQHGDGSGRFEGAGSQSGMKHRSGPRDHRVTGPRSGNLTASEKGMDSKDGGERGGGKGLVDAAGVGIGSRVAGMLGTSGDKVHKDSSTDPAMLVTQEGPHSLSGRQGTKDSLGHSGPSGITEALGAVGAREWQDGCGIPGSPRDRGAPRREDGSADQAKAMGTSKFLGGRGTVEGETWAGIAGMESGQDWDLNKTGSGTTDRERVVGQQGGGNSLLEGRRGGARSGISTETDQMMGSSCKDGEQAKSVSRPDGGQGVSCTWTPGWEDGGLGQDSCRVPRSLQEKAASRQTHTGSGGSRGGGLEPGQDQYQGRWPLEGRGSGLEGGRAGGTEDSGVLGMEKSTVCGDGVILKPRGSGPRGARDNLGDPVSREVYGGGSGGIQSPGCQLGTGQGWGRGSFQEWGSLEAEIGQAPGSRTPRKYEGQGPEGAGWSGRKPDFYGSQCPAQPGTEVGSAKRVTTEGSRGTESSISNENRGRLGETWGEDGNQGPFSHLGSRGGAKVGRSDICGQKQGATQSPRSRYKPGTGSSSKEARGPVDHFSQGLADTEAKLGEAATFSCTLTSDLGPGAWFKDGVKLTAQDGAIFEQNGLAHRLIIAHVEGTHAGKYTFIAGNQRSEARLTVRDPPTIAPEVTEKLRKPLVVKAGKPMTLKIPFQSRLPVQAAWMKDGDVVAGSSHKGAQVALGDDYTRLCLPSVDRKDSGQYSVMLRSEGGRVQAEITVQVIDKPQPPQGPLEVQDCHRAGVCLHWRPPKDDGGRPVEHYVVERRQAGRSTWLKVGEPPPDSATFTDAGVELGRKYAFRVRAVTSEGAGDALESEEVLVAPEALPGPPSAPTILSASSQSITLTWGAPRGPGSAHILGYTVEKRKKGSNAWTAVNEQPVLERKYTVADVRQGCQYEFRVVAVAPSGPGEPGPPSDAVFARDPMRSPGPVRSLQVTDTSNTSITVSWMGPDTQDGDEAQGYVVELRHSDSLQWSPCHAGTVPGTTFTAKGLRPQEGYFVRVTAVNDGGRGQPTALDSLVHAMPVAVSPKFLMDSKTNDALMVRVGDTIRVPVSFEANPMPEVTWLKDGLPLPRRSVTTTKDGLTQLLIPAASLSDRGRYTVVLRSLRGEEAAYSFCITVAACPQAPGPICLQENVPGTVTAQWEPSPDEAQGVPLHYTVLMRSSSHGTWHEVADRVHTNRFTLPGVLPGQEYHFRVVAKNEVGSSHPSDTSQPWCIPRRRGKFTVKAPTYREPNLSQKPRFLVGLRAHLLPQGCECRMTCAVQGSPQPRVTWFKNDQSLEGDPAIYSTDMLGVCSLIIPSVSPKDSGEYKAVAENRLGQAVSTATLIVTESSS